MNKKKWILGFFFLLSIVGSFSLGWSAVMLMINRPSFGPPVESVEKSYFRFETANSRGNKIVGWWYPSGLKQAVILMCHGHGVEHGNLFELLPFLKKAGFSLLFLDFRAHGESEGDFTSLGLQEWEDIEAILSEAKRRGFFDNSVPLFAYGRSMGAATLINGASRLTQINAFILESSFAELRKIAARDLARATSIPDNPLIDFFFWVTAQKIGIHYLENNPVQKIQDIGTRPVLLIHDGLDPRATREDFDLLVKAAIKPKTLIFPNAGHVMGFCSNPELFEKEFLSFISSASGLSPSFNLK